MMATVQGKNGWVEFDGRFLTLHPAKGLRGAVQGRSELRLPVQSVKYVEHIQATMMKNGFIRFNTGSLPPLQGSASRPAFMDALSDAYSIVFDRKQNAAAQELRDAVESKLG